MDKPAIRYMGSINGQWVAVAHTYTAGMAFASALVLTFLCNYKPAVHNELFDYPLEWFPTVSGSTGMQYPQRSIFQILIAIASGPRLLLVGMWYLLIRGFDQQREVNKVANFYGLLGLARTVSAAGLVFVPDTDDHELHDTFVITHGFFAAAWMVATTFFTLHSSTHAYTCRRYITQVFLLMVVPLGHYLIQHRLYQVPGALSKYAFCEWVAVALDIAFDSLSVYEFSSLSIDISGVPAAPNHYYPEKTLHLV